ncbi:MAG: hypothetical protein IJ630_01575 [Treponema sp.]|nr:hypothetical protein [Treponema sp.]
MSKNSSCDIIISAIRIDGALRAGMQSVIKKYTAKNCSELEIPLAKISGNMANASAVILHYTKTIATLTQHILERNPFDI